MMRRISERNRSRLAPWVLETATTMANRRENSLPLQTWFLTRKASPDGSFPLLLAATTGIFLAFSSCSDEKTPTYRVATDEPVLEEQPTISQPLRWKAPEDWKQETPGELQTALYRLSPASTVSITKFSGAAGGIPANVNRWRKQIGLDPTPEPAGDIIALEAGDSRAKWFELNGEEKSILAAIVPVNEETWFFKFDTPSAELEAGRPGFISLLKSIEIGDKRQPLEKPGINLEVPEGWEKIPSDEMRVASFRIPSADGIDGDVSVIPLPGNGGSDLENVNRWRAQLRLQSLESSLDPNLGTKVKGESGTFLLTHMVSEKSLFSENRKGAITTAILRKGDFTWFFKIAGEAEMLQRNRETFESFVRTAIIER